MKAHLAALALTACFLTAPAVRADDAARERFFESRVRPLLAERCFRCHGPEKQRGDLRLDSAAAVRRGGASGEPAVVPGEPDKSLLIRAVRYQHDDLRMPPTRRLKDADVEVLTVWVREGAFFPAPATAAVEDDGANHWAFQPPADPPLPAVKDTAWPKAPVDYFILAELEAKGLKPAPPADRRTLLRRVTFDLTGLPPTPEEVEAFVNDPAPDAFAKVVDRLLNSPHYGERWGRHWLDLARYADSNGLDENVAFGHAWRYRDYVVAAFNKDKPYDRFLQEQIAGDLLPAENEAARHDQLIATGFLALGAKVLAEPDEKKMEMDVLDEQIDTLGRAVLGLTLGCARCHHHKFDPISLEDYYGLAGIFQSTKTMETFKKVAKWHENSLAGPADLALKAAHEKSVADHKAVIQKFVAAANEKLKAAQGKLPANPESAYTAGTKAELKKLRDRLKEIEQQAPEMPAAMGVAEGKVADAALLQRGDHLKPGRVVPRRFPAVIAGADQPPLPTGASGRLELARWLSSETNPLTARVMVNRVWRWHFGSGLVRSTDNFGRLGERPSHPALLDWLARRFVAGGWSVKALHRQIVLSATYQLSSEHDDRAAEADPDNRLHWRAPVRRLEAEALRDALLAVSGSLDRTVGGSLLHVKNRAYFFDHTSKDGTRYDEPRRSLYLPVVRNNLYDVFQLFDSTDATVGSGDRATTTVATQALFWLNGDLVAAAADRLAAGLLARADLDDAGRVGLLYRKAYGRAPTERETSRALAAVAEFDSCLRDSADDPEARLRQAWSLLCQVVVSANEFLYVN